MFVNVNSFEDVESKTFVVRLSVERVELRIPTTSVVLPRRIGLTLEAHSGPDVLPGKKRLRCDAAALCGEQRPRCGCGAVAEQRRRGGRQDRRQERQRPGPQSGKQAPDIESANLGTSEGFSGLETSAFFRKCLAKL